ncbi:MAG: YdcF family protein [Verrucomicrobiae bacterium]|nr:YdcF family protein [Verrucomicrobiae bacterium]NNJ86500.1 YdcF family protein [Akkermansiaceae bacterium]
MTADMQEAAEMVWDYHLLHHTLSPAEIIWVLGSNDLRVADRAVELFHANMAPTLVMSGGLGNFTMGVFEKPEAEMLADRAIDLGVPAKRILIENKSTNTGENVAFTRRLLAHANLAVHSVIAVQKPYMERRAYATIRAQWPEIDVQVTSPKLDFHSYCNDDFPRDTVVSIMVGDLQRIVEYPQKGFMIKQEIPPRVMTAMQKLIDAGYESHLISENK